MKTKIHLVKKGLAYYPAWDKDMEKLKKVAQGGFIEAKTISKRNAKFNAKYWASMQLVLDNLPEDFDADIQDTEDLHYWVKMLGKEFEEKQFKGRSVKKVRSTSFAKMSEEEFSDYYDKAILTIQKHFIPITKEDIENEVNQFI